MTRIVVSILLKQKIILQFKKFQNQILLSLFKISGKEELNEYEDNVIKNLKKKLIIHRK